MTHHAILPHPFIPLTSFLAYATGDERPKLRPDWAHIGEEKMDRKDALEQATVRIDQLIWVENEMANFDATTEAFREFCEDMPEKADAPLYVALPCLTRFADGDGYPEIEEVTEAMFFASVRDGFIFQAAHPVKEWHSETTSSYSWGHYYTAWLYAPDLDGITDAAVAWAESIDAAAKANQLTPAN